MTASEFVAKVQLYCDAKYNDVQAEEVLRWAQRRPQAHLDIVYASLVESQDWRGKLPLVSTMHAHLIASGKVASTSAPVPDERPQRCTSCGNEFLEDQHEVQLCRSCQSMWLWIDGRWKFAPSQKAIVNGFVSGRK